MKRALFALPLLALAAPAFAQDLTPAEAALKAHVAFLASDALKGRDTGSPELRIAEEYVAAQMLAAGLKPGAAGSWFQAVPLVSYQPADKGSFALKRGAAVTPMVWGTDYITRANPAQTEVTLSAPVVFAGYGVVDKAAKIDPYKGLDVRGKIVAVIRDAPHSLASDVRAHYSRPDEQARVAAEHGAVGMILIEGNARHAVAPFERTVASWDSSAMSWTDADGKAVSRFKIAPPFMYVSMGGAEKLFAGSKLKWADILAADKAGKNLPTGALAVTAEGTARTTLTPVKGSSNVVGLLEGSDPALKNEYVVLSAHLDHVGVGKPDANGDTIYNGAMDNAAGTASMLEVAKAFAASGQKPRRSILFVAVTAEEQGLVGSDYFAANPVVPAAQIAANVNLDMPILTYKFEDLVAYGADRSTVGKAVADAAASQGVKLVADPEPEQAYFVRTDHYSFVKAGIPAVSLDLGPGGPGAAASAEFVAKHYHEPSDEVGLIDFSQGVRFVKLNYAITRALADADQRPVWNKGDFFGTLYKGPMAK